MSSILERIFAAKRIELESNRRQVSLEAMIARALQAPAPRPFVDALSAARPAIIAEIKRASPSKGDILPNLDPAAVATDYRAAGAAAISVLTDSHFKGSLADLEAVRAAVDLPLLRKDFIFDPYQVHEARAAGADCILLIAAMLNDGELRSLAVLAHELKMAALVEVHSEVELHRAEAAGAAVIGINNRDLHSFKTDIAERDAAGGLSRRRSDRVRKRDRIGGGYPPPLRRRSARVSSRRESAARWRPS